MDNYDAVMIAVNEYRNAKAAAEVIVRDNISELVKSLMVTNGDLYLRFYGFTPGFNDGEPCEHTFYVDEDFDHFFDDKDLTSVFYSRIGMDEDAFTELEWKQRKEMTKKITSEETARVIESLKDILHFVWGTNWEVVATYNAQTGSFKFDFNECYDCGY